MHPTKVPAESEGHTFACYGSLVDVSYFPCFLALLQDAVDIFLHRPFKSSMKGITHDHAANVLKYTGSSLGGCDADEVQVEKLLQPTADGDPESNAPHGFGKSDNLWLNAGDGDNCHIFNKEFTYAIDGSEMALTTEERQRFHGTTNSRPDIGKHRDADGSRDITPCADKEPAGELDSRIGLSCQADETSDPSGEMIQDNAALSHPSGRCLSDTDHRAYENSGGFLGSLSHGQWESVGDCGTLSTGGLRRTDEADEPFTSAVGRVEITTSLSLPLDSRRDDTFGSSNAKSNAGQEDILDSLSTTPIPVRLQSAQDKMYPDSVSLPNDVNDSSLSNHQRDARAELTAAVLEFARLRSKDIVEPQMVSSPSLQIHTLPTTESEPDLPPSVPEELVDSKTISLHWPQPNRTTIHRYLASMDVIQKQSMVRSLRAEQCLVDLIERDTLGGVDLIIDPHSAIIFMPLHALPSQCGSLVDSVGLHSWRYSHLLLVFEAYPEHQSYRPTRRKPSPLQINFYSPPNVKAVKKLRRDLSIAEGTGTKSLGCYVYMAFANTVDEAAFLTRSFGEFAEANDDTQGALWGTREWLEYSPHEVSTLSHVSLLDG